MELSNSRDHYRELLKEEDKGLWDQEAADALTAAKEADSVRKVSCMFDKDPIKRISGAGELLNRWKLEYRRMI